MEKFLKFLDRTVPLRRWAREEDATAFTEAVILLPIMSSLLMGCFDLGRGITANQKTIGASQIIGDLIARDRSVTRDSLDDIIKAGELAIEPYSTEPFGYDIVSVRFSATGAPEVLWRVTENSDENGDAVESTRGLGTAGDGLIVVTTTYTYSPYFFNFITQDIQMKEVAFLHGRRSATVACADCPTG